MRSETKQLFKQFNPKGTEDLDEWRKIFVDSGDPTEYAGAEALGFTWKEWTKFKKDWPHFRNVIVKDWLAELEIKIRSGAIKKMVDSMDQKLDTGAMKWLAEGKYKPAEDKKGAAARKQEERIKRGVADEIDDDIARVAQSNVVKLERSS